MTKSTKLVKWGEGTELTATQKESGKCGYLRKDAEREMEVERE